MIALQLKLNLTCFKCIKFIVENLNPKHTTRTTIYSQNLIRNYLQKIFKMLSREAGVEGSKFLLRERGEVQAHKVKSQKCLIKIR
jgi:hypothetical protein